MIIFLKLVDIMTCAIFYVVRRSHTHTHTWLVTEKCLIIDNNNIDDDDGAGGLHL